MCYNPLMSDVEIPGQLPLSKEDLDFLQQKENEGRLYEELDSGPKGGIAAPKATDSVPGGDYDTIEKA